MIQVVVKEPGKDPVTKMIAGTLESVQAEVGGYIEPHSIGRFVMYCDEDGKMKGLAPNVFDICHGDILVGNVIVMNGDNGLEDKSLPRILKHLRESAVLASGS